MAHHYLDFFISTLMFANCVALTSAGSIPSSRYDVNKTIISDSSNTDRLCGETLAHLWLDVVVVIENTSGMTQNGLSQAAGTATSVFLDGTKIGTLGYSDPRTTRVSVVTYNTNASIIAELDTYQSTNDLIDGIQIGVFPLSATTHAYVSEGLAAAENVLKDGRAGGKRRNYQQLVILFAASYKSGGDHDPKPVADRLKDGNVKLVTVAFSENGGDADQLEQLGHLASPGFNFSNTDLNIVGEIQGAALQTNCFCQDQWTQYAISNNSGSTKLGVCLYAAKLQSAAVAAKYTCNNMIPNGFLATEFSKQKHDFVYDLVKNDPTISAPYIYFNGLTYVNDGWFWQQPAGLLLKKVTWTYWNPGYPITPYSQNSAVANQIDEDNGGWVNTNAYTVSKNFVCEVASCDTENYCA